MEEARLRILLPASQGTLRRQVSRDHCCEHLQDLLRLQGCGCSLHLAAVCVSCPGPGHLCPRLQSVHGDLREVTASHDALRAVCLCLPLCLVGPTSEGLPGFALCRPSGEAQQRSRQDWPLMPACSSCSPPAPGCSSEPRCTGPAACNRSPANTWQAGQPSFALRAGASLSRLSTSSGSKTRHGVRREGKARRSPRKHVARAEKAARSRTVAGREACALVGHDTGSGTRTTLQDLRMQDPVHRPRSQISISVGM